MRRCRQSGLPSGPHGSLVQEGSGIQARVSAGARVTALLENPSQPIHDAVEHLFRPPHFALGLPLLARYRFLARNVELGTPIDPVVAQRLLKDASHDRQRAAGALAPWTHGELVIESDARAGH